MDFMFEDEVDEVGSDVEAYCPKCKGDTTHVVISKYEDEIRRVQCNPCGDVHSFRKPRGEVEDDVPEPIAAKKRALMKKQTWEEFFAKHSSKDARPYEFREAYHENMVVTHPKFGVGFVSEMVSESKVEVTFKDARRILVHNRKDMPGLPLAAEGDGLPSNTTVEQVTQKAAKQPREAGEKPHPAPKPQIAPAAAKHNRKPATKTAARAPAAPKSKKVVAKAKPARHPANEKHAKPAARKPAPKAAKSKKK